MGCGQSKPPQQRSVAVALCRDRSALLAEAIRRRYALADAHRAYAASLRAAGAALHDFLRAVVDVQHAAPPPPGLLPEHHDAIRDDDDDGHIRFPVDEEDESSDDGNIRLHSDDSSDDGGDGHIQFPSDEETETDPPVPRPRTETVQPAPPSSPQVAASYTYGPSPQVAAPYGYAPPYTYGPGPSYAYGGAYSAEMVGYGQSFISTVNYARRQPPPPSMSYEHRPQVTDASVHYYQDDGSTGPPPRSSYYGGYHYQYPEGGSLPPVAASNRQPSMPLPPPSMSYEHRPQVIDATGPPPQSSYYGGYPYQYPEGGSLPPAAASYRQPSMPLPPPSPPQVSSWDFVNPFEAFQSYYPEQPAAAANHTPSWSSSDPADEDENMPELEDEESGEVVGEANSNECTVVNRKMAKEEERRSNANEELHRKSRMSDAGGRVLSEEPQRESKSSDDSSSTKSSTVHIVDKSLVEEQPKDSADAEPEKMYNDDVQVVQEIKAQFDRASESAGEVCKVLEVGKMPYNRSNSGLKVSSMMICGLPPMGKEFLRFEEEKALECGNLSSTLQKLHMWEKKLLEEVKAEEKIRVLYDQKYEELKYLYNRGAEAHKLEAVQIYTRKLSTKISVAIQGVKSISNKINKLRDEELWPQTHKLIQGFMQMWRTMSECHQIQCRASSQAQNIDSIIAAARFSEAHIDLVKQLELQLLDMAASFAAWFSAQKSYVSTLNEWLKKGIEYVPEMTEDGVPPFSPGRLGAPPVFTICNNWATSMARISEVEVLGTMQALASNVLDLWERNMSEWRRSMLASNQDMDRDLRLMARDELLVRKALEAQNKKLVLVSGQGGGLPLSAHVLNDGVPPAEAGLQSCMSKSFEAMERLATACTDAFKNLHLRSQEEEARLAQENGTVS